MTEYEVNCILRVLAKVCYSKVSSNPDLLVEREDLGYTAAKMYTCYQSLEAKAPETMLKTDFLAKFISINYDEAAKVVSRLDTGIKQHIVQCLLHMTSLDIVSGAFTQETTLNLIEGIALEANIMDASLSKIIDTSKREKLWKFLD